MARAVVRAAKKNQVGAFLFEIAMPETDYTEQLPGEYAAVIMAAAIREGYEGPLFIQGDHFQVNAKGYAQDPDQEIQRLKKLIKDAITAGFYNIDIDTSTLVDLSKPNITEQQRLHFELAVDLTRYIRGVDPEGITISIGGEIGEVGGKKSTVEEFRVFMDNYKSILHQKSSTIKDISKISIQTGTSHGSDPLPVGSMADVKLDFDILQRLSKVAREDYGLAGAVQHEASTLPPEVFDRFPQTGTVEIHLATEFQNMIYANKEFPADFREEIYEHLRQAHRDERKPQDSEEQFIYKTRKKAFGPFKEKFWSLPPSVRQSIGFELEDKFSFLFKKLNVIHTDDTIRKTIPVHKVSFSLSAEIEACKH
jgi:fructose/tagatose bisphosphate aldolase